MKYNRENGSLGVDGIVTVENLVCYHSIIGLSVTTITKRKPPNVAILCNFTVMGLLMRCRGYRPCLEH